MAEDAYKEQQWDAALKKAFLGTDEDIRAGTTVAFCHPVTFPHNTVDPGFFNDPSGCTAVAALFTQDKKLFVVSCSMRSMAISRRIF